MKGVRLEAIRVGSKWHTTWDALYYFFEQVTAASQNADSPPPVNDDAAAVKSLRRKGII